MARCGEEDLFKIIDKIARLEKAKKTGSLFAEKKFPKNTYCSIHKSTSHNTKDSWVKKPQKEAEDFKQRSEVNVIIENPLTKKFLKIKGMTGNKAMHFVHCINIKNLH